MNKKYTIGMWAGDPFVSVDAGNWHYEDIHEIIADSLDEAITKWSIITDMINNQSWDATRKSYFGFSVEEVNNNRSGT